VKQANAFASFSGKRRILPDELAFGGTNPNPWVGFAESWALHYIMRNRTNAFCFFFWKKKNTTRIFGSPAVGLVVFFEGVGRLHRTLGQQTFCEAEQTLFPSLQEMDQLPSKFWI
jgi:hypothetical protein